MGERKSYWRVTAWLFLALAILSTLFVNPTMGSVWVACALVCHAARGVLVAVERLSTPQPNADEGDGI